MSAIFSRQKVDPVPQAPDRTDEEVAEAARRERQRLSGARTRSGTILTSAQGTNSQKTLLGQ